MGSKRGSPTDLSGLKPKNDTEREIQEAIVEDADKSNDANGDLVHGDGRTVGLSTGRNDLSQDN